MSAGLTVGQRAWLRAELVARQQQLEKRLAAHHGGLSRVEHARAVLEQDGDDAPQREGEREVDLALSDFETQALAEVGAALSRVDDDRFGLCADCAEAIPLDRLKAEPWALRCVGCETRREAAVRRPG